MLFLKCHIYFHFNKLQILFMSWNNFPWSSSRSEFQWYFKTCRNYKMLIYCQSDQKEHLFSVKFASKYIFTFQMLTHWPLGDLKEILDQLILKLISVTDGLGISVWWNCPQMQITGPHWWWVNTGSGNGLVPSDNKSLAEPIMWWQQAISWFNVNPDLCHHMASLGHTMLTLLMLETK